MTMINIDVPPIITLDLFAPVPGWWVAWLEVEPHQAFGDAYGVPCPDFDGDFFDLASSVSYDGHPPQRRYGMELLTAMLADPLYASHWGDGLMFAYGVDMTNYSANPRSAVYCLECHVDLWECPGHPMIDNLGRDTAHKITIDNAETISDERGGWQYRAYCTDACGWQGDWQYAADYCHDPDDDAEWYAEQGAVAQGADHLDGVAL